LIDLDWFFKGCDKVAIVASLHLTDMLKGVTAAAA
jgi:hypothetical protein